MGAFIKILGTAVKLLASPIVGVLAKIPRGKATGTGTVVALAGLAVQFGVSRGWIPAPLAAEQTERLAAFVTAAGAFIAAWGTGRAVSK